MRSLAVVARGLGVAALVGIAACSGAGTPTADPTQVVTVTNHSPRVVFLVAGWSESQNGEVTAGEQRSTVLAPCGGTAAMAVSSKMWLDRESVRTLPVGLLVDGFFNEDIAYSMLPAGQTFTIDTVSTTGMLPFWTRADVTQLPLALVVDPDVTVREVDPAGAVPTIGPCTPQTRPTPGP